jgi:hypothetical protein
MMTHKVKGPNAVFLTDQWGNVLELQGNIAEWPRDKIPSQFDFDSYRRDFGRSPDEEINMDCLAYMTDARTMIPRRTAPAVAVTTGPSVERGSPAAVEVRAYDTPPSPSQADLDVISQSGPVVSSLADVSNAMSTLNLPRDQHDRLLGWLSRQCLDVIDELSTRAGTAVPDSVLSEITTGLSEGFLENLESMAK